MIFRSTIAFSKGINNLAGVASAENSNRNGDMIHRNSALSFTLLLAPKLHSKFLTDRDAVLGGDDIIDCAFRNHKLELSSPSRQHEREPQNSHASYFSDHANALRLAAITSPEAVAWSDLKSA